MTQKQRYTAVITYFAEHMPEAKTELNYTSTWSLLVAVILSAQCTDKRVNTITPKLLGTFNTPLEMANASVDEIFQLIRSISYPNAKAQHLQKCAGVVALKHGGEVPDNRQDLEELAGVGRKTANVILSVAFNVPAMPVDTHVFRVSHRIGLVASTATTPLSVEKILTHHFPKNLLNKAHHWLILHGRYTCKAIKPKCNTCGINNICKEYEKNMSVKK